MKTYILITLFGITAAMCSPKRKMHTTIEGGFVTQSIKSEEGDFFYYLYFTKSGEVFLKHGPMIKCKDLKAIILKDYNSQTTYRLKKDSVKIVFKQLRIGEVITIESNTNKKTEEPIFKKQATNGYAK